MARLFKEEPREVVPDCHFLPDFLDEVDRAQILRIVRKLKDGWHYPKTRGGFSFSVKVACFGHRWTAGGYLPPVVPMPDYLTELARAAVDMVTDRHADFRPETAICNWYAPDARLGLHVDAQEDPKLILRGSPIVTFSLGDNARFLFCPTEEKKAPESFQVASGDAVVFFGKARVLPHGIDRIYAGTDETRTFEKPGRLSITIRQVHP